MIVITLSTVTELKRTQHLYYTDRFLFKKKNETGMMKKLTVA